MVHHFSQCDCTIYYVTIQLLDQQIGHLQYLAITDKAAMNTLLEPLEAYISGVWISECRLSLSMHKVLKSVGY